VIFKPWIRALDSSPGGRKEFRNAIKRAKDSSPGLKPWTQALDSSPGLKQRHREDFIDCVMVEENQKK